MNHIGGARSISRQINGVLGIDQTAVEYTFSCVLDFGPGIGADYLGVELSFTGGGPVVFLGKPPSATRASPRHQSVSYGS